MSIHHQATETKSRYSFAADGGPRAGLTCSRAGDRMIPPDHFAVPATAQNQGVSRGLVQRAVTDMRSADKKITPLCPLATARFKCPPDWQDVLSA